MTRLRNENPSLDPDISRILIWKGSNSALGLMQDDAHSYYANLSLPALARLTGFWHCRRAALVRRCSEVPIGHETWMKAEQVCWKKL